MKKRILSILLTLCMLLSVVPMLGISVSAYSAGEICPECYSGYFQWTDADGYHKLQCPTCTKVDWDSAHENGAGSHLGCTLGDCASGGTGDNPGGGDAQQEAENLYNALTKPTLAPEDMTYTLQADVVFDQSILITYQKILYLNGHTITFNNENISIVLYGGENGEYTPSLAVYGGSNEYAASCFDSDGSIISYNEYSYAASSICVNAGTLTVHGGKISGIDIANNTFSKAVNIYSGFIYGYDGCFDAENTTLNITGGYYTTRGMLFDAENNPLYADGYGIKRPSIYDAAYNQGYTYQVVKAVSLKSVSSLGEQGGVKFYQETVGTDEQVTRSEVTSVVGGDFDPYVEAIDVPGYTAALSVTGNATLSNNYLYIGELYYVGSGMYPDSVTVTATYTAKTTYAITADTCAGGTVTTDKSSTYEGDTVTVTATPASGYGLDKIYVNSTAINGTTFTMPAYDVTVSATFKPAGKSITYKYGNTVLTISGAPSTYVEGTGITAETLAAVKPSADDTPVGMVFDCWVATASASADPEHSEHITKVTNISASATGDIVLYARFVYSDVTLTGVSKGGYEAGKDADTNGAVLFGATYESTAQHDISLYGFYVYNANPSGENENRRMIELSTDSGTLSSNGNRFYSYIKQADKDTTYYAQAFVVIDGRFYYLENALSGKVANDYPIVFGD